MGLGQELKKAGWKQGHFVKVKDHAKLNLPLNSGDRIIIITQTCDIVKEPDYVEPYIELIIAQPKPLDGNCTFAKNARKLSLQAQSATGVESFTLHQTSKIKTEKKLLSELAPDEDIYLEETNIRVMTRWLAARYERIAYPDTFNNRIKESAKNAEKKIKKATKKISPNVSGLYIELYPFKEIPKEKNYTVNLLALVPEHVNLDIKYKEVEEAIKAIKAIMEGAGMTVEYRIKSEADVPYSLFRTTFKQYEFDHLSLSEASTDPLPVPI